MPENSNHLSFENLLRNVIPEMFNDLKIPINGDISLELKDKSSEDLKEIVIGLLLHQQSIRKNSEFYSEFSYSPIYTDVVWCF